MIDRDEPTGFAECFEVSPVFSAGRAPLGVFLEDGAAFPASLALIVKPAALDFNRAADAAVRRPVREILITQLVPLLERSHWSTIT
jgi:hypothetical protein